jgi:hypothetical protein
MRELNIGDLFSSEELKNISYYEETFSAVLVQLERFAIIAERFPVSFKINNTEFSYSNKNAIEDAIASLKVQYDNYAQRSKLMKK